MAGKGLDYRFHRSPVFSPARERAIEIDHMEELRTGLGKQHGLGGGVIAIDGGPVHIAFSEAHHLPCLEVDGGKDDHGHHSRKRARSCSP